MGDEGREAVRRAGKHLGKGRVEDGVYKGLWL
jgi:hypothetical protein